MTDGTADRLRAWLRSTYVVSRVNSALADERKSLPPHLLLDFGNAGLLGLHAPKQYGGLDLSQREILSIIEQLGALDLTLAIVVVDSCLCTHSLLSTRSRDIPQKVLPLLAAGRILMATSITEPGAGSNPRAISSTARARRKIDGTREWVISGTKSWVGCASWASYISVLVQTEDENGNSIGLTTFLLPRETKGLKIGPEVPSMGLRGFPKSEIYLEEVTVDDTCLLSEPGKGMESAQDTMGMVRLWLAAAALGAMKRALQIGVRFASRRPIATGLLLENGLFLHRLGAHSNLALSLTAALYHVADAVDRGEKVPDAVFMLCKAAASEALCATADDVAQFLGARGYDESNELPRMLRDARPFRIFEGPTEALLMFVGYELQQASSSTNDSGNNLLSWIARSMRDETSTAPLCQLLVEVAAKRDTTTTASSQLIAFMLGEASIEVLLSAATRLSATTPPLQAASSAAALRLDAAIARVRHAFTCPLPSPSDLLDHVRIFEQSIGDVVQTLPGLGSLALTDPLLLPDSATAATTKSSSEIPDLDKQLRFSNALAAAEATETPLQSFLSRAATAPDAPCLVSADTAMLLAYRVVQLRVEALALGLSLLSLSPDALVGLYFPREKMIEQITLLLAVHYVGAAFVPLDPSHPIERIRSVVIESQPALIVTADGLSLSLASPVKVVSYSSLLQPDHAPTRSVRRLDSLTGVAYVLFTSGTTGRPKGVPITHAALSVFLRSACALYDFRSSDRILQFASLSFDTAMEEIFGALFSGAALVVRGDTMISSAQAFIDASVRSQVTVWDLPTSFWHSLCLALDSSSSLSLPQSLRTVIVGGERMQASALQIWQRRAPKAVKIYNTYGPTESTVVVSSAELSAWAVIHATDSLPIGQPLAHGKLFVLSAGAGGRLDLARIGSVGELYIGGPSLSSGYLRRPELTASSFILGPPLPVIGRIPLYKTGDLVRWTESGMLVYVGRVDDQVKIRGQRVEVSEIEGCLVSHCKVTQAAVLAVDSGGEKQLLAFVAPETDIALLRSTLSSRLPPYMVPAAIYSLPSLPLSTSQKIDRHALLAHHARAGAPSSPPPSAVGSDPISSGLAEIWRGLFGAAADPQRTFMELGGHSLLAFQLLSRVQEKFGVSLPMRLLFEPTSNVPGLAALIRGEQDRTNTTSDAHAVGIIQMPLVAPEEKHPLPLSYSQELLWFLQERDAGAPTYNEPVVLVIGDRRDLDLDALRTSLARLVRRHSILRTTFVSDDTGDVCQVIRSADEVTVPIGAVAAPSIAALKKAFASLVAAPFDLSHPPLLRLTLGHIGEGEGESKECYLLVVVHHLLLDGPSLDDILIAQLLEDYQQLRGRPSLSLPLRPAPDFAACALAQRAWLGSPSGKARMASDLQYWREKLSGLHHSRVVLRSPSATETEPTRGAKELFTLPPALYSRLKSTAASVGGLSPFALLCFAFQLLAASYSSTTDVCVGSVISSRFQFAGERATGVLGPFLNTVPLRASFGAVFQPPSRVLVSLSALKAAQATLFEAEAHSATPFQLVAPHVISSPDDDLFDWMIVMEKPRVSDAVTRAGWRVDRQWVHSGFAKSDLLFEMQEHSDGSLVCSAEYRLSAFDALSVSRLLRRYLSILSQLCDRPPTASSPTTISLSDEERPSVR